MGQHRNIVNDDVGLNRMRRSPRGSALAYRSGVDGSRDYALDFVGERVRSAAWGDVHLNVYTDTPTIADLDRLADAQRQLRHRREGNRLGVFSFAEAGFEMPSTDVRRHGAQLQSEMSPVIVASAVVVDGAGFWVSAAISVVNTIALLSRPSSPARVFRNIDDAAGWMARSMPVDPGALISATERLRGEPAAPG